MKIDDYNIPNALLDEEIINILEYAEDAEADYWIDYYKSNPIQDS